MDPSTRPATRSPISTNERREMLLFLARSFVPHAGITNNGSAHTDSVRFCRFGFSLANTAKWFKGAYMVIDLAQFPVRISKAKAPTPLTTFGILFLFPVFLFPFFFFFFFHSHPHSEHRFPAPSSKLCQIWLRHRRGTLYLRAAVHRRGQRPPKGLIRLWKQASAQACTQT